MKKFDILVVGGGPENFQSDHCYQKVLIITKTHLSQLNEEDLSLYPILDD